MWSTHPPTMILNGVNQNRLKPLPNPHPRSSKPSPSSAKKGRGGKQVTVMRDFQLSEKDLGALGKQLKKRAGVVAP